ncbi:hypothetical protein GGR57DRAFT_464218 [Xylariaceae sp. FL1272]|nr:hypothetical protein GGR57DRAFT_464218 [Xylariaceae sp. FL1272]
MQQDTNKWSKTVFRVRGLPLSITSFDEVAQLVYDGICPPGPMPSVYSLSTSLNPRANPTTKVATIMFKSIPPMIQSSPDAGEWHIQLRNGSLACDLILDVHFLGMTPLSDVTPLYHTYDCIAISGLASHALGSWQPKGGDKTFMWIRDELPKEIRGIRTIIYGYDSKLQESESTQMIPDLAKQFIDILQAYGWGSRSGKPLSFLAHSLGGLVLKEALVRLASESNEEYSCILDLVLGAIFFGVPNLGMEQNHFRTVVRNNPNQGLIDDIRRYSPYVVGLNERFFTTHRLNERIKCFWAYELLQSPTLTITHSGETSMTGSTALLVSPESATYRFHETDVPSTIAVQATHSDMVKYPRDFHTLHIIISKISQILENHQSYGREDTLMKECQRTFSAQKSEDPAPSQFDMRAELTAFRRLSTVNENEENGFLSTGFGTITAFCNDLQARQEHEQNLMHLRRLEPFLKAVKEFEDLNNELGISYGDCPFTAYTWGPMSFVLRATCAYHDIFDCILNVYQELGDEIPRLGTLQSSICSKPFFKEILAQTHKDILWFHAELLSRLKRRGWKKTFRASWASFTYQLQPIKDNLHRNKRLIENNVSLVEFQQIQDLRSGALQTFQTNASAQFLFHRATVMQWLGSYDCRIQHEKHQKIRSVCKSPGVWLVNDPQLRTWLAPESEAPLLWLNGVPGAGKSVLASIIIDEAQRDSNNTVLFFYCKFGDGTRNSFISLVRSLLSQLLTHNPGILPILYEKASLSGDVLLTSASVAEEILQIALSSCEKTCMIIIDGVDECGRDDRKAITTFFCALVDAVPAEEKGCVRCLFVSQDDGIARRNFQGIPFIKIRNENQSDLEEFGYTWQKQIEEKFGNLRSKGYHISRILSARARGMFIFAELFAKFLIGLPDYATLAAQLDPAKLPISLDSVYERILERIFEDTTGRGSGSDTFRQALGWIVCARRPLRWAEIQGALCIDLETQKLNQERKVVDSPKHLFASLVEVQADGTVELVHNTAGEFLIRKGLVQKREADYGMTVLSLGYLALPQIDKNLSDEDVRIDLISGIHAFYDYASACWASHLLDCITDSKSGNKLIDLRESLETFVEVHWSPEHKPLSNIKRIQDSLKPFKASTMYDHITQAVGWARKQSSKHGQGPTQDEPLDIWRVTQKIRSVLESFQISRLPENDQELLKFYGDRWFKCPRVNCLHYYRGFDTLEKRQHHINKHERPYLCYVPGCHMEVFGYPAAKDLKKHLLKYHGIDLSEGTDLLEFPSPSNRDTVSQVETPATYLCLDCGRKFTRKHNLMNHTRSHKGEKPHSCGICGADFARQADCERHKRGHEQGKRFTCIGDLRNGHSWGCQKSFGRQDNLITHYRSQTGQRCIRPRLEEILQDGGNIELVSTHKLFEDEAGENADILRAVGRSLPTIGELCRLCGLD